MSDKDQRRSAVTESLRSIFGRGQKDSTNPNSRKIAELEEEKRKREEEAAKYNK